MIPTRHLPGIILAAVAAFALPRAAPAQGTRNMLPNPISSRDLALFGEMLELSPDQQNAIEPFHAEYREAFRALREGEIEQYMQEVGGFWRRRMRTLDIEVIESSLKRYDRLMSRIGLLDERFFSDVQTVLTDEQTAELPRVTQARRRQRLRTGLTRMVGRVNSATRVDLSRLHARLELDEESRAATEPFVRQYETRLTSAMARLHEATTRIFLEIAESLQEQGFLMPDEGDMPEQDRVRRMREVMRTAWAEALEKPRDAAMTISELNWRTLRQITEFLPDADAIALRDRYLRRAYPEVPRAGGTAAARSFRAALRDELPGDLAPAVEGAAAEYRAARMSIEDKMVALIDDYRASWQPGFMSGDDEDTHEEKLEGFRRRLAALDDAALESLRGLLGAAHAGALRAAVAAPGDEPEPDSGRGAGAPGGGTAEALEAFAEGVGPDPFLPGPLTRRDLAGYRDRLGIDRQEWFILESLHEEYVSRFNGIRATSIAALREAQAAVLRADGDGAEPPTDEQVERVYALRAEAMRAIRELDAVFFDDLETLIAPPEQQPVVRRMHLAREREVYNRAGGGTAASLLFGGGRRGGWWGDVAGETGEGGVDLSRLVEAVELDDEARKKIDAILLDYERQATEAFRRQYEAALDLRREAAKARAQAARAAREAEAAGGRRRRGAGGRWQAYRAIRDEQGRAAREAGVTLRELNRSSLAAILEAVAAEPAAALQDAYNRAAYPVIYAHAGSAEPYLSKALKLRDLDGEQRARVESIRAEYAPALERVAAKMIAIYAADEPDDDGEQDDDRAHWQRRLERRNRLEVLEFELDEVNASAVRKLRNALTEAQAARIHLPAEVAREGDGDGREL